MERLPFLIEYGAVVWAAIAATAGLVAVALVRRLHVRWAQRATARELAGRAARTTAPVEGPTTIRGTLRGGGAASISILHLRGARPYYDERAPKLWLDCDGARVALDGPIRVIRGTRVVSTRDRGSALPDDELAVKSSAVLHRLTAVTVSVRDGDPVFVTAQLAPRAGADALGYREASTAWAASPGGGVNAAWIEVVAAEPAVRILPLGRTRTVAAGLAGTALAMAALWLAGAIAMHEARTAESADDPSRPLVAVDLGELDAVVLAAATPGNRGDALGAIEARFATRYERTAESFALWRQVARLRGGCGGELAARMAQDEVDDLARIARSCDDEAAVAGALAYLGLYREAAVHDHLAPADRQHIALMITAPDWIAAAGWAARVAPTAERAACAARWFRDPFGLARSGAAASRDPVCAVLDALARPEAMRADGLVAAARSGDARVHRIAETLAWVAGAPVAGDLLREGSATDLHRALFDPADRMRIARALLARSLVEIHPPSSAVETNATLAWRSIREHLADNVRIAKAWSWHAARDAIPEDEMPAVEQGPRSREQYRRGHAIEVALAVRTGDPLPPLAIDERPDGPEITHRAELSRRYWGAYWHAMPGGDRCDRVTGQPLESVALAAARDRDGSRLADVLTHCRLGGSPAIAQVFAVWPRIDAARDRLAEATRRLDLGPPTGDPLALIARAALRRDLAELAGDRARAEVWQAITLRHIAEFSEPSLVVALLVSELLQPADR